MANIIGTSANNLFDGVNGNGAGSGNDTISYSTAILGGITVNLFAGTAVGADIESDTLINIENIIMAL